MRIPNSISNRVRRLVDEAIDRIPNGHVLVASSGGPDSTALAVLAAIRGDATLGHVNHHLGPQAHRFEQAVAALGDRLGLPVLVSHVDPDQIRSGPKGLEAEARTVRYRALRELSPAPILTAHTAHDRLDTILMRLAQGTGADALDGPRSQIWVDGRSVHRPMLDWFEEDVATLLEALDIEPVLDPSNSDPKRLRNRIRPVGRALTDIVDHDTLARSLAVVASDAARLRGYDDAMFAATTREVGDEWWIGVRTFETLDSATRATVVHGALKRLGARGTHKLCVQAAKIEAGGHARAAGVLAEHCGQIIRISNRTGNRQPPIELDLPIDRSGSGPLETPLGSLYVGPQAEDVGQLGVALCPDEVTGSLRIRSLRAGDRFVPFGRTHEVRLSDLLAKDGVPASARRIALVLADDLGPIWIVGGRRSARALVREGGSKLSFRWTPWGGQMDAALVLASNTRNPEE